MDKERPITLTAQEVNAVLAGDKTQHRVPALTNEQVAAGYKHMMQLVPSEVIFCKYEGVEFTKDNSVIIECPFGSVGDRLWVQEELKHRQPSNVDCCMQWAYASDNEWALNSGIPVNAHKQKLSAKSMPRWASRLLLEITDICIERIQDISEADAKAMGLKPDYCDHKYQTCEDIGCIGKWASALFLNLRHEKKLAVHYTAWVWVIEFKVIESSEVTSG